MQKRLRDLETQPHALYRFFAADGTLLYIGLTANPGTRWKSHAAEKPWWLNVVKVTVEHFPTRSAVIEAERNAIQGERPLHNVTHNRDGGAHPGAIDHQGLICNGDVIAVRLTDGSCPVGIVKAINDRGIRLRLYAWISGYFDLQVRVVFWDCVVDILHARERYDSTAEDPIFEMDPLGDFQSAWERQNRPTGAESSGEVAA
jgi:predicted GIY-YIG superfamily endonuclease